ncbi:hypothetical protein GTP58_20305 [Duganella sp. CY15W]|uniref:hypothetical protein n=1 Tax=Duganella sp. CY15W TaxID=2692172 RepID=UPI00136FE069|nr:hypothetical protein [Duganella sp. CY15W]MYM30679.1 hypothetical protein [Duganella sp. CY15W]
MNQIKLNTSRNAPGFLVVNLLVNGELAFATTSGQQLACAIHEIGIESFVQLIDTVSPEESTHDRPFGAIEDQIVWHDVLMGFIQLQTQPDAKNSAEYQFVAGMLPEHLRSTTRDATFSSSETAVTYFKQFVTYPAVGKH